MKIYNLKCPNCGATLSTDAKNKAAKCSYCGNEFILSDTDDATEVGKNTGDRGHTAKTGENESQQAAEESEGQHNPPKQKQSHARDFLIVFLIVAAGLVLNFMFDKEQPQDIVPQTDLHRFFTELQPDSTPQSAEALAQKYKLHFFRMEKAVNTAEADTVYYKVAKTNETALNKPGAHAETVEIEFDMAKGNALMWAAYSDPGHIVSHALLFNYGTYYSLTADRSQKTDFAGYYFYNNSLRSSPDSKASSLPYLKCSDAVAALNKIYTYKK